MNAPSPEGDRASDATQDDLAMLRSLLFQPEKKKIEYIQTRLEDRRLRAEDISEVLAEAFLIRLGKDDKLAHILSPTIENAIKDSAKHDMRALVDAISPLMGPAIRRSILQTIHSMIQSMNEALNQSFSIQGFKWRWEAFRTGKSFGEVVLLHTLVFQVEQVFLIHRETGLLLQHVSRQVVEAMDPDMVSGMLTAIQDFVRDSFGADQDEALQTMQVGELTVWIEQGPQAVLAAVIRGTPPVELRTVFQEALENVHMEQQKAFEEFDSDPIYFEDSRRYLTDCLRDQYRAEEETRKKRTSPLMWLILAGVLAALGFWVYTGVQARQRWHAYLDRLDAAPGIVVVESGRRGGKYYVSGLRDPLAQDPEQLVAGTGLSTDALEEKWALYQSFDSALALKRARLVLAPPERVQLSIADGVLSARGEASHAWIEEARRLARGLPGIAQFDVRGLRDVDLQAFEQVVSAVNRTQIFFNLGSDQFSDGQEAPLAHLADQVLQLVRMGPPLGADAVIEVYGHTDPSGAEAFNQALRKLRAQKVIDFLIGRGVSNTRLLSLIAESGASEAVEMTNADLQQRRQVSFRVVVHKREGTEK